MPTAKNPDGCGFYPETWKDEATERTFLKARVRGGKPDDQQSKNEDEARQQQMKP